MFTIMKIALIGTCILGMPGAPRGLAQRGYIPPQKVVYTEQKTGDYIGEDKAKEIAFKDAGVKEKDASYVMVHLDREDGIMVYDVEFMVGNEEYDYDIDATTGDIVSKDFDIEGNNAATNSEGAVTKEEAIKTALKDAGVKQKETTYLYVHLDHDDGAEIYEVEFMVGNKEYDYDIDANTGKILSKDFDIEDIGGAVTTEGAVTKDQAKEIAVKDAGFSVKDVTFKKVKQEFDDGIEKIKVEFINGDIEYEYEIDAKTGKILEFSTDSVYDD